ncbi:SLC13 family permease, partial [Candidatus Thorarchaeota archaeon]
MQSISVDLMILMTILLVTLILFVWGRWRYDIVALFALLAVAITGIISFDQVFLGFGHPAVITVAAVLVISRGLTKSGFVDVISRYTSRVGDNIVVQIMTLTGLVIILSAFMNNIGALAILMPVAIRMIRKSGKSPSLVLMPLAFGSMLGGLITLIGTPPNIIIATFRDQYGTGPFFMFDFAPVGLGIAIVGFLFISLVGWRLIPQREGQADHALIQIKDYVTELYIPEKSKMIGKRVRDLEAMTEENVAVVAILRKEQRFPAPSSRRMLREGDVLILRGESREFKLLADSAELGIVENKRYKEDLLRSDDVSIIEAVIMPHSLMVGKSARNLQLHSNYGVNILAIARQGRRLSARLGSIRLRSSDVLLMQVPTDKMSDTLSTLGCLSLAEREIQFGRPRQVMLAVLIFGSAILVSFLNILPIQIAFTCAALAMVAFGVLSINEAYKGIDWPVIILLGAMIPVGQALEISGGAQMIANTLLEIGGSIPPYLALLIILVITMFLSDLVNNAATAVLMAPIAINVALGLGVSIDPFLMAVAIGASSAFLTPIGHQSST